MCACVCVCTQGRLHVSAFAMDVWLVYPDEREGEKLVSVAHSALGSSANEISQ